MSKSNNIISKLKAAKKLTIKEANEAFKKRLFIKQRKWQQKRDYIDYLLDEFQNLDNPVQSNDKIFISFSKEKGEPYYVALSNKLKEYNFEAINGFQDSSDEKEDLLRNVLSQIKDSSFYVGILTKEIELEICDEEQNCFSPSIWTMEEKGMAFGLGKPFLLLIQKGIHKDFWRKTAPIERHIFFNDFTDFNNKLENICDRIFSKFLKEHFKESKGF